MTLNTYDNRISSAEVVDLYIESPQWDLFTYLVELSIYEDMDSPFLSGSITIMDPIAMTERIPITGWQKLVVNFRSNADGPFTYWSNTFRIYKIDKLQDAGSGMKNRQYRLHFISEYAAKDMNMRISRSFMNMTEDKIASNVIQNILSAPIAQIESSKYPKSLIVPNWRPTQILDYCCKTAIRPSSYESANYVLFETLKGFKFISIDSIIEGPTDPIPFTHGIVANLYDENRTSTTRQAKQYKTQQNFDYIETSRNGGFATEFLGIDPISKKWEHFNYNYSSEFGAMPKIDGGNAKLTENTLNGPEQLLKIGPYQTKPRGYNSDYNKKHLHKRRGHMMLFDNIVYDLDCDGDTRVECGSKVEFDLYSYDSTSTAQVKDALHSGKYIVSSIHHIIDTHDHRQVVRLKKPHLLSPSK